MQEETHIISTNFNLKKALEATQYLLNKNKGEFDIYLLNKILYLAERESWIKWGRPLIGDKLFSLPWGPVLSDACDLISSVDFPYWSDYIKKISSKLVKNLKNKDIDELNKREMKLLDELYEKFGKYSFDQMKEYCHNLPEWEDPKSSSKYIPINELLTIGGKTEDEIGKIQQEIEEFEYIKKTLVC